MTSKLRTVEHDDMTWVVDAQGNESPLGVQSTLTDEEHASRLEAQRLSMLTEDQYLELMFRPGLDEDLAAADAEESFRDYIELMWPIMEAGQRMTTGWAVHAIADHLQAVTDGDIQELAIFVPPGMGKSAITCVYWPTWEWGPRKMPHLRYITASYSEDLTLGTNRLSRALIESDFYKKHWRKNEKGEDLWIIDPKQDTKTEFATSKMGFRFATSTGGTITGKRGHRLIFDDLHSAQQAESDQIRTGQVTWFRESAQNRVVDKFTKKVLIMQKLHANDVGAVAKELGWTILCLPMRYEHDHPMVWVKGPVYEKLDSGREALVRWGEGDPRQAEFEKTGKDGQLLFEERFDEEMVTKLEEAMQDYAVSGQNQQRPTPRGGGTCKAELIEFVQEWAVPIEDMDISRGWDFASSKKKGSAFTASAKIGIHREDGLIYLLDAWLDKLAPDELSNRIVEVCEADGIGVRQSMPKDPAQAGDFQAFTISSLLHGHVFDFSHETGSKDDRFKPFVSQVNAGKVRMVIAPWNERPAPKFRKVPNVRTQLSTFPMGVVRDLIDAISRAYMDCVMNHRGDMGVPTVPRVLTVPGGWKMGNPYGMR